MSEDEYRALIWRERIHAQNALAHMLHEWRRELWPDPRKDPVGRENRMRRERAQLAARAYWGVPQPRLIYGGICGS